MASQWFRQVEGQDEEPVSFQHLAELVARGEVSNTELVRREGTDDWQPVESVVGLLRAAEFVRHPPQVRTASPSPREASDGQRGRPDRSAKRADARSHFHRWKLFISLLLIAMFSIQIGWMWFAAPVPFPEAKPAALRFQVPSRLEQMRPRRPAQPTLADLPSLQPVPVPGLEKVTWLKMPSLNESLTVLAYVSYRGDKTLDDLFIAQRASATQPFEPAVPVESSITPAREAFPALSPDGLELIYTELGQPSRLLYMRREAIHDPFDSPVPLKIEDFQDRDRSLEAAQFLGPHAVRFSATDAKFMQRTQIIAVRPNRDAPFRQTETLALADTWPRLFVTPHGRRAYFLADDGLYLTVVHPRSNSKEFVTPERVIPAAVLGMNLTKFDDTPWLSFQEDILFYCSPGVGSTTPDDHRLWMIRF